ncbi:MAG: hypothetical protein DRI57_09385 [Deltaproteobacteria bacterium]|nr:MAG: hypothetical protein DRI57_09385 [Deltaproteobacteria bacterium]
MNTQMNILKEVGMQADNFRKRTRKLGETASEAFSGQKAQMKNLENIANSALKVSDVLDYIKRQTGKSDANKKWKKDQFGEKLLKEVKDTLGKRRDIICRDLGIASEEQRLHVYLLLIREFIKQLVIFYEYSTGK